MSVCMSLCPLTLQFFPWPLIGQHQVTWSVPRRSSWNKPNGYELQALKVHKHVCFPPGTKNVMCYRTLSIKGYRSLPLKGYMSLPLKVCWWTSKTYVVHLPPPHLPAIYYSHKPRDSLSAVCRIFVVSFDFSNRICVIFVTISLVGG